MRDLEGIRNAHFDQRLRACALDLLIELKRCAEALGPDSPRGISAKALVDRVWGDMPQDTTALENPTPPRIYQPQGRHIPLAEAAGQGEVCVPADAAPIEAADPRE